MTHVYKIEHFTNAPPTARAFAERDALAEDLASAKVRLAAATSQTAKVLCEKHCIVAESSLVVHMVGKNLPLENFSTPSGRAFIVRRSVIAPIIKPGREREARQWLAGRSARTLAHKFFERGGWFPTDLFEPMQVRVRVRPAKKV